MKKNLDEVAYPESRPIVWTLDSPAHYGSAIARALLLVTWLSLVLYLSFHHVFWRDEVRALSFTLQGSNVLEMLKGVKGDAHPAAWFLLLRGMHAVFQVPEVLSITALFVAFVAMLMLIFYSPFRVGTIALVIFGGILSFEFSVMARNYGISLIFLFLFATQYQRGRERGYRLGAILFFLANCNAHSILLCGILLLFWFCDLAFDKKSVVAAANRQMIGNACLAFAGLLIAFYTIYPSFNDAAAIVRPNISPLADLLRAICLPSERFFSILRTADFIFATGKLPLLSWAPPLLIHGLLSILLYCITLGFIKRPAALIATVASIIGFSVFATFVYAGSYRHQALWVMLWLTLHWIILRSDATSIFENEISKKETPIFLESVNLAKIGYSAFIFVLLLQLGVTYSEILRASGYRPPASQSASLAKLLKENKGLRDAIVISDPDYFVEPLAYYANNKTYLIRESRFGNIVHFTKNARLDIDLADILTVARRLHEESGRAIVILLGTSLSDVATERKITESYNWTLTLNPAQVKVFLNATELLMKAIPVGSDETFDVYLLKK